MRFGDDGQAAVELGLAVGLLLFPVALAVLSFGPWTEARVTAEAMAAEASRAAVVYLDGDEGVRIVDEIADGHGYAESEVRLGWCGAKPKAESNGSCAFLRGSVVTASIQVYTPLFTTPWGEVGGVWVGAEHSESIDLYRSIS